MLPCAEFGRAAAARAKGGLKLEPEIALPVQTAWFPREDKPRAALNIAFDEARRCGLDVKSLVADTPGASSSSQLAAELRHQ